MAEAKLRKFTGAEIVFHWLYGGSWLVLCLTGMAFLWRGNPHGTVTGLGVYLQGSVGQSLRSVHRVAALLFMSAPLVWMLMAPGTFLGEVVKLLTFRKGDGKWLAISPVYYTMGKPPLPPQGKYNAGHKVNGWIVFLTYFGFAGSGLVMWFARGQVSAETFRLMLLLHDLFFWVGLGMATLHMYLTLVHPFTRQSLSAMVNGFISLRYARAEHALWVAEQVEHGKAKAAEVPSHD